MKNINPLDDYALLCGCGSVKFSLLKSSLIECNKCGKRLEKTMYWTEEELKDAFERVRLREVAKNIWIRLKGSELHAKSKNPEFLRGAKWAEATLKGKRREHLKQFEDKKETLQITIEYLNANCT
jgi:ribosomal protein L37AE/L43A